MATKTAFIFYRYDPSSAAAIIFVVLFALCSLVHLFQLVRARTWYFIPFVLGGIAETIGYVGRVLSAKETPNWTQTPYIIQSLLILIAPALFAASIYMVLGRIVRLVEGEKHSIIRSTWVTKIFVTGDVLSFFMQGAGGGLMSTAKDNDGVKLGENVILGGLFFQLLFFCFFIVVTGIFHYRISRDPTPKSLSVSEPWNRYLYVLYGVSMIILVRNIFRIIEYIQGFDGYLQTTETFLYVFDATLMFLVMVILIVMHPSKIISGGRSKNAPRDTEALHSSDSGAYNMQNYNSWTDGTQK